jgi:ATP-dependent exoDNAse (exonuclease V) alpha subunit
MGEKRKRELRSISPNILTLNKNREFNCSNQKPIEIITISSDEDEPQPKRFNSTQQLAQPNSPKKSQPPTEPSLCQEQQALVDLILSGRNVFYTGSAGCGKSTVLKAFVKELKKQDKKVNIIAPTGRAALDINGQTFWTYAGWTPLHMKRNLKDLKKAAHGKFINARLRGK